MEANVTKNRKNLETDGPNVTGPGSSGVRSSVEEQTEALLQIFEIGQRDIAAGNYQDVEVFFREMGMEDDAG